MSQNARKILAATENESRAEILREFQNLQIRIKAKFQNLLAAIEDQKKKTGSVPVSFLFERSRLATLLVDVAAEIKAMTPAVTTSIRKAQRNAVDLSAQEFDQYIKTSSNAGQIVRFNPDAAKELIGNTQILTPLQTLMDKLPEPLTLALKAALIDGVANGSGARAIASEINTAIGTGSAHALTIARTETNQAYRQASLIHYQDNTEIVKGWIWLSALDLRTCPICWSRHGVIYPLNKKPQSHPNCRCTMLPYLPETDQKLPETGEEQFKKLSEAQKVAIVGKARADLYKKGLKLGDFVGEKQTIYGSAPFIKNLADLPAPVTPPSKKTKPVAVPKPKAAKPATAPVSKVLTSDQAAEKLKIIHDKFGSDEIKLVKDLAQARADYRKVYDPTEINALAKSAGVNVFDFDDLEAFKKKYREEKSNLIDQQQAKLDDLSAKFRSEAFEVVKVEKPSKLKVIFESKFTKDQKNIISKGVDEFRELVDEQFLSNETLSYQVTRDSRSYYTKKRVRLSKRAREIEGRSTVVHETAHGLEQLHPDLLDQAVNFWEYRTKGQPLIKLSKATGLKGYGNKEVCKVDKFKNPYDGKEPYHTIVFDPVQKIYTKTYYATEIITRGMEYLWNNPAKFAVEQPEYFDFIFTILRGRKWQPK